MSLTMNVNADNLSAVFQSGWSALCWTAIGNFRAPRSPHCSMSPFEIEKEKGSEHLVPSDSASAQVAVGKIWPRGQHVLYAYIMNPKDLTEVKLNPQNIFSWAHRWERPGIPKIRRTNDVTQAQIRIKISKCTSL